jgi:hypothetical protein
MIHLDTENEEDNKKPSYGEIHIKRHESKRSGQGAGKVAQMVECLHSKCEAKNKQKGLA